MKFSNGFTERYLKIIDGIEIGLMDARPSIEVVQTIGKITTIGLNGRYYPQANNSLSNHLFVH